MKEKCSSLYLSGICKWFIHIQESSVMFFCSYSEKYTLWVDEFRSGVTVSAHSFIIQSINTTVCQCECEGMSMFWQSNLFNTNHKLLLKKQNNLLKHVDINSTWHILNMSACQAHYRGGQTRLQFFKRWVKRMQTLTSKFLCGSMQKEPWGFI